MASSPLPTFAKPLNAAERVHASPMATSNDVYSSTVLATKEPAIPMPKQLAAEFVGTFMLVFTVGCNVLIGSKAWAGVSIASVLMVMIYSFGKISGGNFNPAVSVALGIAKQMGCKQGKTWKEVGLFSAVQIVAGILAGFCYYALFNTNFNLGPAYGFYVTSALACEFLYTFVLCFVVLNVANVTEPNSYYGLAIGFVVIAGAYGAGAISGGCFNPAVAIGIDVIGARTYGIGWAFYWTIVELLAAAVAAFLFFVVRPEEFNKAKKSYSKFVSEFIGTFVLVLTIGLTVQGGSRSAGFAIAASLMCMIYALGSVSGANFNPAVTLAIYLYDRTIPGKAKESLLFMVAQILGGIAAGFTYTAIYMGRTFPLGGTDGFGWAEVTIAEIVFTAVLCLVVLSVAVVTGTKDGSMFGFAIGSCITVGAYAIGSISGGSLNPAVSFGIASAQIWDRSVPASTVFRQLVSALIYTLLEFAGAGLAAGIVSVTHKAVDLNRSPLESKLTAEFVGTFLLVFTVGCNVLSRTPVWAGVSIASVLMVMIYAFAGVSGANFNPAVSITLGLRSTLKLDGPGLPWKMVGMYCGVQTLAGILAGLLYYAVFDTAFNLAPGKGFYWTTAGVCELFYTCMLCFVVLNVTLGQNSYAGLAIGFVVVAGAYGAGAVSGGCFNPAVAIGIDFVGGSNFGLGWSCFYVPFEIAGAALACGLFKLVRDRKSGLLDYKLYSKLISEFLGTFMLVLTVGLNVMASSPAAAFSIAASLMCMIYALGDVSGAHFNPAVTLAVLLCEGNPKAKAKEYALYMVVQILGGILAALTYMRIYGGEGFPLGPGKGYGWAEAAVAEIVFTFLLCLVVLCVAVKGVTKNPIFFGLAIGSCVTVGGFAIGGVSGGSLNPAVSFGIAMSQFMNGGLTKALIYSCLEFVGAGLAAGVLMLTHPNEYQPKI